MLQPNYSLTDILQQYMDLLVLPCYTLLTASGLLETRQNLGALHFTQWCKTWRQFAECFSPGIELRKNRIFSAVLTIFSLDQRKYVCEKTVRLAWYCCYTCYLATHMYCTQAALLFILLCITGSIVWFGGVVARKQNILISGIMTPQIGSRSIDNL